MENYNSDKIEELRTKFYTVIGRLELEAAVIVTEKQLEIFETVLQKCQSEDEAAACILGNTRRFERMLTSKRVTKVDADKNVHKGNTPTVSIFVDFAY